MAANHRKVLESWHKMEKASLHQDLNVEQSVLRVGHASELDAMDSVIRAMGRSLKVLDPLSVSEEGRKASA